MARVKTGAGQALVAAEGVVVCVQVELLPSVAVPTGVHAALPLGIVPAALHRPALAVPEAPP